MSLCFHNTILAQVINNFMLLADFFVFLCFLCELQQKDAPWGNNPTILRSISILCPPELKCGSSFSTTGSRPGTNFMRKKGLQLRLGTTLGIDSKFSVVFFFGGGGALFQNQYGGFLKWWYPTTMGFPKNDHFGVFWGYHHFKKHPYLLGCTWKLVTS